MKKILPVFFGLLIVICSVYQISAPVIPGEIKNGNVELEYRNVTVYAPAVAQTEDGYIGVTSTITVTIQSEGSGRVFVDTLPLTQIDMQGSARLAVKVASALVKNDQRCVINPSMFDYFFVIRTSAPIIGGPSAGGIMTTAVVALLENWTMNSQTMMTGMINPDGSIGPVGGILQKIDAAYSVGVQRFLIPKGQGEYVETITETQSDRGWTQIITRQVLRNVSDYAINKYGIEVVEAEDINDALHYFTGFTFQVNETNESITTEDYIASMKPLATSLLNQSKKTYMNASDLFNATDIPNRFPYYFKNQITGFLNSANEALIESENWFDKEGYYTSTSKSFQSLISSNFVIYGCNLFSVSDQQSYVLSLLKQAESLQLNNSEQAKNAVINGTISLQCVGAAQKRASESETYIFNAYSNYQNNNYLDALYNIAFANQRSNSIEWWIGIAQYFNDSYEILFEDLEDLAREYIEDAQQSLVYSQVILQEMGKSSAYLSDAETMLEAARNDKEEGYLASAIFQALESLANSNLALELVDGLTVEKVQRYRESASASISESRLRGIEPVLAVSYYEYAENLENESSIDAAAFYYKYSDLIPGALTFTSTFRGQSSRYLGIPQISISLWPYGIFRYMDFFILLTSLGTLGGLCIGIVLGLYLLKGKKEKKERQKFVIRDSNEMSNKQTKIGETSFYEAFPRSINDYYQKKEKKRL